VRIQRLKILGFKSFAQKVEIQFEGNGLTAIVGPNGAGKSNIVDAIRWVMGEQKASLLRMDKMQGVIFSGTEERPAMSMAEVSLIIENDRKLLPSEYSEIMITRRAFSNGESEYLINSQDCRLADIRNLFADTGMGANSYSQMDQRMVDALLSDKADERRTIFEEAAGVSKYKKQRKDAVSQLERVQIDMERIALDLQYAKNQFRQQEKMLARAAEFRKLKNRLKEIDVSISIAKYTEGKASQHALSMTKSKCSLELETLKARLAELETKIEEKRLLITSEEEDLRESEREVSSAAAEAAKLSEAYKHLQNRGNELDENSIRCEREIKEGNAGIFSLKEEMQNLEMLLKDAIPEIEETEREKEKESGALQRLKDSVENLRIRHRELSNKRLQSVQINMLAEQISQAENEIQGFESQIEDFERLKESKENEARENQSRAEILQEKQTVLSNEKEALRETLSRLEARAISIPCAAAISSIAECDEKSGCLIRALLSKHFPESDLEKFCPRDCEAVNAMGLAGKGLINLNSDIAETKEKIKEADISIAGIAEEKRAADSCAIKASSDAHAAEASIAALKTQKEKTEQEISNFEIQLQNLKNMISSNAEPDAAGQVQHEFERIDGELAEQERLLKNHEEQSAEISNSLTEKKSLLAQKENRLRSIKEQIQTLNNALILRSDELEAIKGKKADLERELEGKTLQIESQQELLESKEKLRDEAREKYNAMGGDIEEWRTEVREINRFLREKEKNLHELDLAMQASDSSLGGIRERIYREYEFDLELDPEAQSFSAISIEERDAGFEMRELQEKIKAIGPINASAAEDLEAERERVLSKEAQFTDLSNAKNSLSTAIERLDLVARDRFLDTFRKIQRNYQDVFSSLMPGGEALLAMQPDLDPLEAEIEINARPTGKKMRGVRALSGGERALTATSLLFALYMVKPSPYCILDEIDGPLDDANIGRFLALLRRFSHQTQFVVITHNKRTMAGCDALYGVSQEIKGISKIGSIRLEEVPD
jgi:chromosome segregation protein